VRLEKWLYPTNMTTYHHFSRLLGYDTRKHGHYGRCSLIIDGRSFAVFGGEEIKTKNRGGGGETHGQVPLGFEIAAG
jgi:hypothetical protein